MDADPWADASPAVLPASSSTTTPRSDPAADIKPDATGLRLEATDDEEFEPGSSSSASLPLPAISNPNEAEPEQVDEGFDEFDDFDAAPIAGPSGSGGNEQDDEEDAFGDFGDFEEGDFDEVVQEAAVVQPIPVQEGERLPALSLRPFPPTPDLIAQLSTLLSPILQTSSPRFTSEPPRLASSSRQILPTESSRDLYVQLASPLQLKPLDWTRSRVRREHLIALGVPVNLDEVDSHRLSSLPALTISTNFEDMRPPASTVRKSGEGLRRSFDLRGKGKEREQINRSTSVPVSVRPRDGGAEGKYGLGARPGLDVKKAEELCGIDEDQLSLLPPQTLKKVQDDLVKSSADASALLAHLLQLKDAQSQDAATYNGMISELIANAAKVKSAQQAGSGGVFRRSSAGRPASAMGGAGGGSGNATPRTGSPVVR